VAQALRSRGHEVIGIELPHSNEIIDIFYRVMTGDGTLWADVML